MFPKAGGPALPCRNAILALSKSGDTVRTSRPKKGYLFFTLGVNGPPNECR